MTDEMRDADTGALYRRTSSGWQEVFLLRPEEEYVVWAALESALGGAHEAMDNLTKNQYAAAKALLDKMTARVVARATPAPPGPTTLESLAAEWAVSSSKHGLPCTAEDRAKWLSRWISGDWRDEPTVGFLSGYDDEADLRRRTVDFIELRRKDAP